MALVLTWPERVFDVAFYNTLAWNQYFLLKDECRLDNETFGPYEKGCLQGLELAISENAGIIGAVVAIVAVIQICIIVVTSFLMKNTEKPKQCPPFYWKLKKFTHSESYNQQSPFINYSFFLF